MKKKYLLLLLILSSAFTFQSCSTKSTITRNNIKVPPIVLQRSDYIITENIESEAEVKYILGGLFIKGMKRRHVKTGAISGRIPQTADERMAVFNLIQENDNIDYVTNLRYIKEYKRGFFSKTYTTKVIARGIILKTNQ